MFTTSKVIIISILALLLVRPTSAATALTDKLELTEMVLRMEQESSLGDSSPLIAQRFASLRTGNGTLTEGQWSAFRAEAARHLRSIVFRPGGPLDAAMRQRLDKFSEAELKELIAALGAPALVKYMALGAESSFLRIVQKEVFSAFIESGPAIEALAQTHGIDTRR